MPLREAPTSTTEIAPLVGSSGLNFFDGNDISLLSSDMSFLPPTPLPPYVPQRKAPSAMVSNSPAFLPPVAVSHAPPRNIIEHLPVEEKKKGGRPTKAEKLKARQREANEVIAALVEDKPSKKDVFRYFEARIEELRT